MDQYAAVAGCLQSVQTRTGVDMYKNLLVPVDGTELSDKAIRSSIELAQQLGAAITAFVAEPLPPPPAIGRSATDLALESEWYDAHANRHAKEVLSAFETQARTAGVAYAGHYLQTDRVADAIATAAAEHKCDMIVMATHGRGPFGTLLFGSQTKLVMAQTKVPLLVLH